MTRLAGEAGFDAAGVSPVTVILPDAWASQGYTTLPQVLANLVPSFVYPEPALADFTDHARPAGLRGLAPDQMVVLLDGKRRNPAAWLHREDTYGRGSVGVDLSVVPLAAVERIEILQGGASARYGSGAIAGVINVVLKEAVDGGSVRATFGQHRTHMSGVPDFAQFGVRSSSEFFLFERGDLNTDDGEGDTLTVSVHGGFTLFDDGYLDITAEFRDQEPTNRSGYDPRNIYPDLPNGDFDPREAFVDRRTHRYGNPEQEDVKLLTNFGMPLTGRTELYGHLGYTARNAQSADEFVLARSDANVPAIHPDGYLPLLDSDDETRYLTIGFRGWRWGWAWDLSYSQDEHEMDLEVGNTVNASLGSISPIGFAIGNYEGRHVIIALDLAKDFDVGLSGPLAVTWGLEYRDAEYENEFGDRGAYVGGGASTDAGGLRPPGSQGFYGVRPVDDFDNPLTDLGAYVQLEAPLNDRADVLLGMRYDDEEDNGEFSGRAGIRWGASDRLTLRSTVSRDFRNPSAAQRFFFATELTAAGTGYVEQGTYPVDHPVALALGADGELSSEVAMTVSGGADYRFGNGASVTLDLYQTDVGDRIVLSNFLSGSAVNAALASAGISGVGAVRYFLNGVDTRVRGADLTAHYLWQTAWGPVELRAGFNANDIEVTAADEVPDALAGGGPEPTPFGERDRAQLESWTPDSKLHLGARWEGERLAIEGRLSRYGEVTDLGPVPEQDQDLGSSWLLDFDFRYRLTDRGYAGFGVHNFFDEYVDARPRSDSDPVANRIVPYSNYAPYGFNGRFVYLRLGYELERR